MASQEQNRRYHDPKYEGPEQKGPQSPLRDAPGAYDAIRAGEQLREGDDVDALAKAIAADFRNRASNIIEPPKETPVSFAELESMLTPRGIDLTKELNDQAQREIDRGHIAPEEVEAYKAQFDTIHVRIEELENIQPGQVPLLFIDNMTLGDAMQKVILGAGIPQDVYSDIKDFKKVNLQGWARRNQIPSGLARLTFTPDITGLQAETTGRPSDEYLEQMEAGKHFLQPQQWLELFRRGLERAIKELNLVNGKAWKDMTPEEKQEILWNREINSYLTNKSTGENIWTQFPDWRNGAGRALRLIWGARGIVVMDWSPQGKIKNVVAHPAIG